MDKLSFRLVCDNTGDWLVLTSDDILTILKYTGGRNTRITEGLKSFYNVSMEKANECE